MSEIASAAISIGFHGLAFAMVLYLISVGLSVTMGLMGFVNLAHGAFAMARRLCDDHADEPFGACRFCRRLRSPLPSLSR